MSAAASIRSWLFVPGDSARKQEKAAASAADALIFDLEDSVTEELLPQARAQVCAFLASHRSRAAQQLWVRVNALASGKLSGGLGCRDGGRSGWHRAAQGIVRARERSRLPVCSRILSASTIGHPA